jgi:gamma-glutamyl hydrolase
MIQGHYGTWLESSGAMVIPLIMSKSEDEILSLLDQINGVLFPGGGIPLYQDEDGTLNTYASKLLAVYNKAKKKNDEGIHFPIWGTCWGLQLMHVMEHPMRGVVPCCFDSYNLASTVKLKNDPRQTKLLANVDESILDVI